jgi:hypothetical protein
MQRRSGVGAAAAPTHLLALDHAPGDQKKPEAEGSPGVTPFDRLPAHVAG